MSGTQVRTAVALYLNGDLSEGEAARCADLSRAQLREYVRTCGTVVPAPSSTDEVDCAESDAAP